MNIVFEKLKEGDYTIVDKFVSADKAWAFLLSDIEAISIQALAEKLSSAQYEFEGIAGSRHLGKMIFGLTGFTHLYSCTVGFDQNAEKAKKLAKAFEKSFCAVEVKHAAREAAKEYGAIE